MAMQGYPPNENHTAEGAALFRPTGFEHVPLIPWRITSECKQTLTEYQLSLLRWLQQRLELLNRHRFAEQIALICHAAVLFEKSQLRVSLHAFGDDIQSEIVRHVDDGPHHDCIERVSHNIVDETPVDLELIKRELFQIGQ